MQAILSKITSQTIFQHQEWQVVPNPVHVDCFNLEEVETAKVLRRFVLVQGSDPTFLNLIACAPQLKEIVKMYQATMKDSQAENSKAFSIVTQVLECLAQPCIVETMLWV